MGTIFTWRSSNTLDAATKSSKELLKDGDNMDETAIRAIVLDTMKEILDTTIYSKTTMTAIKDEYRMVTSVWGKCDYCSIEFPIAGPKFETPIRFCPCCGKRFTNT